MNGYEALALTVTYLPATAPEVHVEPQVAATTPMAASGQPQDSTGVAAVIAMEAPPAMAVEMPAWLKPCAAAKLAPAWVAEAT